MSLKGITAELRVWSWYRGGESWNLTEIWQELRLSQAAKRRNEFKNGKPNHSIRRGKIMLIISNSLTWLGIWPASARVLQIYWETHSNVVTHCVAHPHIASLQTNLSAFTHKFHCAPTNRHVGLLLKVGLQTESCLNLVWCFLSQIPVVLKTLRCWFKQDSQLWVPSMQVQHRLGRARTSNPGWGTAVVYFPMVLFSCAHLRSAKASSCIQAPPSEIWPQFQKHHLSHQVNLQQLSIVFLKWLRQ